jgi:hypothetical protein
VNVLVTALIVYKIVIVYNDIRGADSSTVRQAYGKGHRDLYPLISILIESGLITSVAQLLQSIMYNLKSARPAFPLVSGCVVMLYVRIPCQLLIWWFNLIYLLHRESRPQLSLYVSRWV